MTDHNLKVGDRVRYRSPNLAYQGTITDTAGPFVYVDWGVHWLGRSESRPVKEWAPNLTKIAALLSEGEG